MKTFNLEIVTPTSKFDYENISYLRLPSYDGLFGVQYSHADAIIGLDIGEVKITIDNNCTAAGSSITMTAEASRCYVTGLSSVEPISGVLPTVVPAEQTFAGITTANLEYFRGSGRARDRFRATSFQDFVFITNTQKKTAYDSSETLTRFNVGSISNAYQPFVAGNCKK